MTTQPDLSPRAKRTRAALIAAGFDLLVERPIDAIPIDDVVAKAAVAKGSFFNHFRDKQAFAEAIATEVRLELENQVALANADVVDPVARIAGGMRIGAELLKTTVKPIKTTVNAQVTLFKVFSALGLIVLVLLHSPKGDGIGAIGGQAQLFTSTKSAE
ncbi:MAG: preprotein translocase subunit SecG, partial [Tabrizicola sp.]